MSDTYTEQMDSLLNPASHPLFPATPSLPKEFIESFKNRNNKEPFKGFESSAVPSPLQKEIYDDWTETGAIAWAGYMGTIDSIRGAKQIVGAFKDFMKKEEKGEWGLKAVEYEGAKAEDAKSNQRNKLYAAYIKKHLPNATIKKVYGDKMEILFK